MRAQSRANPDANAVPSQERDAFGVDEFCARHSIGRSHFCELIRAGEGPAVMKAGSRTLISREAAARWRAARELAAATVGKPLSVRAAVRG
jgi:hypothetical protein